MLLLQEQLEASKFVTVSNQRDGVWTALSSRTPNRPRIGGEQRYKRRIDVRFTPLGIPYLHCDCNFYVQRGIVCSDVLSLKRGLLVQADIHPRFWINLSPPSAATRLEWNAECHPTIDGVPGISAALIARLREQAGRRGDDGGHDDGDSEQGDGDVGQSFDVDADMGDTSAYTQVTAAEITKVKAGATRFNSFLADGRRFFGRYGETSTS